MLKFEGSLLNDVVRRSASKFRRHISFVHLISDPDNTVPPIIIKFGMYATWVNI